MLNELKIKPDFDLEKNGQTYNIRFQSAPLLTDVCFYSSYSFTGVVEDYVYYYLQALNEAGFSVVFVSTSKLSESCLQRLKSHAFLIIERENKCPDFGSWKLGLTLLNGGQAFDSVLLANDSVFGPFCDLSKIVHGMRKRYDVWGMTDSYEIDYHLQSYFLFFNKKVVSSNTWHAFWQNVDITLTKKEVITQYEVGISKVFFDAKFRVGAYASVDVVHKSANHNNKYVNPSLAFWKILIEQYEFPFLKREVLIRMDINKVYWERGLYINVGKWRRTIAQTIKYPVDYIDKFIRSYYKAIKSKNSDIVLRKRKILFLSHNAEIGGAQRVLLNFLGWLIKETDIQIEIILCREGNNELAVDFSELGVVTHFYKLSEEEKVKLKERLIEEQIALIFSNTCINVKTQQFLSFLDVPQIVFVHELPYVMKTFLFKESDMEWIRDNVSHFIACADVVKQNLMNYLNVEEKRIDVVHEFISPSKFEVKDEIRIIKANLGIPVDAFVVGLCGTFEWRKSADLLPIIASSLCCKDNNIHIIWLGAEEDSPLYESIQFDLTNAGLKERVHLITKKVDSQPFFSLFDVFLMVSREDPFPLVNLESGIAGKPVICFRGSGGSAEYVAYGTGHAVPYLDIPALSDKVLNYYNNRQQLRFENGLIPKIVKENFTTETQAPKVFEIIKKYYDEEELIITEEASVTFMVHIFYDNSWEEIKNNLKRFDNGRNYFLFSISEACLVANQIIDDIKRSFKKAYFLVTSNIGKDIGGKMALIDLYLLLNIRSSYIVFLHDKQSPQTLVGESWKNNLYKIVDPNNYKMILRIFKNPKIGLVGAKEHIINEYDSSTRMFRHNNTLTKDFLQQYNISIDNYEYLSGTMYWLRSSIIESFFSKNNPILLRENLEAGNVLDNYGDTLAHTWERMFCWIVTNEGYLLKGI